MTEYTMFSSFDGTKLALRKDVPQNCSALVLVIHGLCEHLGRYDYVASRFYEAGLGVYRFDHRGHGRSEGERTYYSDYNEIVDDANAVAELALQENPGKPLFVVGHSMGGYCSLLFGAKYPGKAKGIVLSGALSHDTGKLITGLEDGLDVHGRIPNEMGAVTCSVQAVLDALEGDPYLSDSYTNGLCYSIRDGLQWLAGKYPEFDTPILILHGDHDLLVNVQDSYQLFGAIASKDRQLKVYGGLYHEIFNEYCRDEVIGDAVFWILRRIG